MGTLSAFTLTIRPAATPNQSNWGYSDAIMEVLRDKSEMAEYALTPDGDTNNSCRWYDARLDIQAFSKSYPDALFVLQAMSEDRGDIWMAYILNGNVYQRPAKITYPGLGEALEAWGLQDAGYDGTYQLPDEPARASRTFTHREPRVPVIAGECHQ